MTDASGSEEYIDLQENKFSGSPLSPFENAQLRRMIREREQEQWLKNRYRKAFLMALGVPVTMVAVWQLIEFFQKWIGKGTP